MKPLSEITVCCVDAGTFPSLAQLFVPVAKKVYYNSPWDEEYLDCQRCIIGDGLEGVERLDDYLKPEHVKEIDLFVFPDRGFIGPQELLRALGKAVWGSFSGSEIELYRTRFYKLTEELGLPVVPYEVVRGVGALRERLKEVQDKWIKVNRFRANMETWHHIDFAHSRDYLAYLEAVEFGGVSDTIVFLIQDPVPDAREIGYDGWNIVGKFPRASFQGYEKKNELYLGTVKKYTDLPDPVRYVNDRMAGFLGEHGYCNFWATEIRLKDGVPYFIDPTPRMPGQTGEQLLESCSNLPEVIWHGANGELVEPEFEATCAAEATIHYEGSGENWRVFNLPKSVERWVKLYQCCLGDDGLYHFPPGKNDELGVVLGQGDSPAAAVDHLKENLEELKDEPVHAEVGKFVDLLDEIEQAEKEGMPFSDKEMPTPAEIMEK